MAENDANLDLDVDGDGEDEAPPVKSGKPWIKYAIFGLIGLLLLGGIGGSTYYLVNMLSGDDAEMAAMEGEEGAEGEGADAATPGKKKPKEKKPKVPKAPLAYLPLHPPFVVNFGGDSFGNLMQVGLEISSRDPVVLELAKEHKPAIRNDLVLLFSNQEPSKINSREGKEQLRQDILATIRKTLKDETGKDRVENVYFTSFVMQ